jgi:hypothetical protein
MLTVEQYKLHYALTDKVTPQDEAEQVVYTLIEEFANDSNSAKYREDITKLMVGLRPSEGKLGYDDDFEPIEVKPVNYTGKGKLDGKGNFSDFTWKRHHKYLKDGVRMLVSGFNRGKLLYIVEFPYTSIQERVEYVLNKKLPNGDIKGTYVRTLAFHWNHWSQNMYKVVYVRPTIGDHRKCFNKKFYNILTQPTTETPNE